MKRQKFISDGFAGFGQNGKARIIGAVKKDGECVYVDGVTPFFALTEDALKKLIADAGFTLEK